MSFHYYFIIKEMYLTFVNKIIFEKCKFLKTTTFARVKGKATPVTGHGGPMGGETSMHLHFLHDRLTDAGEVVSLCADRPLPSGRFLVLISVRG
jgi:hypothetical protein